MGRSRLKEKVDAGGQTDAAPCHKL